MLTPNTFSYSFESFMNNYISLVQPEKPDDWDDVVDGEFTPDKNKFVSKTNDDGSITQPVGDYPSSFASSYEEYSLEGIVLGAVHGAQQPIIIESFMRTFSNSIIDFATALANYWGTVLIINGLPLHGGVSVISVVNDAPSKIPAFQAAILASITTEYKYPVMSHLMENIEAIALPQVTWIVTEMMPNGSPASFPEKVV